MIDENTNIVFDAIRKGDRNAFDKLVSQYEKVVYRICHRFFNNENDALDASQEIFIKIYRNIDKFEGKSSLKTWIYRIASNTCITLSEKNKKEKEGLLQNIVSWWQSITQPTPEDITLSNIERGITQGVVKESITKIPEVYRIPVILKDIEGLPMEKISEILEIPIGTVKSRLNRGRRILHDKLEPLMKEL